MLKALKVLLGFKVRTVLTFDPPGTYQTKVVVRRSVPARYRLPTAIKVLQNNSKVDILPGLYAMQVLLSEEKRAEHLNGVWA